MKKTLVFPFIYIKNIGNKVYNIGISSIGISQTLKVILIITHTSSIIFNQLLLGGN